MFRKIIIAFVFLCSAALAQAIGPKVTIPQINYDYTNVPRGEKVMHTYMIYNGGDETLNLRLLNTSCHCISADLNKTRLAPSDSARLNVEYTNTGNAGKADKYVTIKTNDPANPSLRIYITRANPNTGPTLKNMPSASSSVKKIKGPSIYFPRVTYDFGKMQQGAVVDHLFKFYNKGSSKLIIKDIRTSCGCTAAIVKSKELAPGQESELRVQFDSSGKIGKLSRRIMVYSNDPHNIEQLIFIYADVLKVKK